MDLIEKYIEIKTIVTRSLVEERHVGRLQPSDTCVLGFYEILQIELLEAQTGIIRFVSFRQS